MKKKFSLLLLAMVLVVAMAVPAFAKTKLKDLEDGTFEVTFIYGKALDAAEVYVGGAMNEWKASHPDWQMKKKDGVWKLTKVLEKGTYAYKFVVNGSEWRKDPNADAFKPDGFGGQNSVVKVLSNALKGQFKVSGDLTHQFEQMGEDADVAFFDELNLKISGTAQEKIKDKKIDRLRVIGNLYAKSSIGNVEDEEESEIVTIDEMYLKDLKATYLGDVIDVSVQANVDDNNNTYDYLNLIETQTLNEDRDNTSNLNEMGDVRRVRVSTDNYLDMNVALAEYTGDITDSSSQNKYIGYLNAQKSLLSDKLEVGTTLTGYQPIVAGDIADLADSGAVFAQYDILNNFNIKAEYANVPAGSINESLSGTYQLENGKWRFTFDPRDYSDWDAADINSVWVAGEKKKADGGLNDWNAENEDFTLEEVETAAGNTVWQADFDVDADYVNEDWGAFKFIVNGEWVGTPGGGSNFAIENPETGGLDGRANIYFTETNYKFVDQQASMQARIKAGDYSITKYKGEITAGAKSVAEDAYLKLSEDDLAADKDTGYIEYYANGNYDLLDNLNVNADILYKTQEADTSEIMNQKVKTGFDWTEPIIGLDNVKGHFKVDPEDTDDFDGEVQEVFAEAKTTIIPFITHVKANTTQRLDSSVNSYYVESGLDIPVDQIAHIKGNVFYADDAVTFEGDNGLVEDAGLKYFASAKVHQLPFIKDYMTHLVVNYESDEDGITDEGNYDDDDNDWKNKIHADTKFNLPLVNNLTKAFKWDGLFINADFKEIEDKVLKDITPGSLDEDYNAKYVVDNEKVELYSILGFETGMDLPFDTRVDASFKYDLNHGEISEYEDDSIKVEVTKSFSMRTSLNAYFNKQDDDEDDKQVSKLYVETIF